VRKREIVVEYRASNTGIDGIDKSKREDHQQR
jgi:hypothetical protein